MLTLDQIGKRHATDKASNGHGYLSFYEPYLAKFRDKAVKVLEIGILDGASLRVWRDYFPNAQIYGADINPTTRRFADDRTTVVILDQSNVEQLADLAITHGKFDVIIEDGSHLWEHQITTLRTLFPFLNEGGVYVVEDLETNYGALAKDFQGVASISCMEYLKQAVDLRVAGDQVDISKVEDAFLRTYARSMTLSFSRHCCLIQKHAVVMADYGEPVTGPALRPPVALDLQPKLAAHFGTVADIIGVDGAVSRGGPGETIQGFAIRSRVDGLQIRYRALREGGWSPWIGDDQFAGTRGLNIPLQGFGVRLEGPAAGEYGLTVLGRFGSEIVEVGDGEDCVSPNGEELTAIQLVVRRADD